MGSTCDKINITPGETIPGRSKKPSTPMVLNGYKGNLVNGMR
jgi:hypothetical protein